MNTKKSAIKIKAVTVLLDRPVPPPTDGTLYESRVECAWYYALPTDAKSYEQIIEQFWNRCLRMYEAGSSMNQAVRAGFKEIGISPHAGRKRRPEADAMLRALEGKQ